MRRGLLRDLRAVIDQAITHAEEWADPEDAARLEALYQETRRELQARSRMSLFEERDLKARVVQLETELRLADLRARAVGAVEVLEDGDRYDHTLAGKRR